MKLYNTRSKQIDQIIPIHNNSIHIYCCGPTVYDYAHIGNFRTYTITDFLVRSLKYVGYAVKFVMNLTDVGHLTSDSDTGDDKLEKGAKRDGKTAWDIAAFYIHSFLDDSRKLHLIEPDVRPKPTDHIPEQIELVKILLAKGNAYIIDDGIYFDTSTFPNYGELTKQNKSELLGGARVELNPQKRNTTDFALWKFSPKDKKRDMEWDSPWGVGFPGWHIECSAMGMKYLGPQIDIHTGGADLIPIHHTNEIAQSEAVTGLHPYIKCWVHVQFLMVDSEKMSKSKGNFWKVSDIEKKGYDPLVLRYFYLTSHYRSFANFTWNALDAAANSLKELRMLVQLLSKQKEGHVRTELSEEKLQKVSIYQKRFQDAIENDLNLPQALAVVWEVFKSNIPSQDKFDLISDFDSVLGLDLIQIRVQNETSIELPNNIQQLIKQLDELRKNKNFVASDEIRKQLEQFGYTVINSIEGTRVEKH